MAKYDSEATKKRILSACVKLFIEKGYRETTMTDILKSAHVSAGSFHNIFRTKDGVLIELTRSMYSNQFSTAEHLLGERPDPVMVYALETSIQLAISELNENLRQIYVEAYTCPESIDYINERTAEKLIYVFGQFQPDRTAADIYELEVGTSGMMRSYMARKCDMYFTLERKIERFLSMSLKIFDVPESIRKKAVSSVLDLDIRGLANSVMQKLFEALAMKYEFTLQGMEVSG